MSNSCDLVIIWHIRAEIERLDNISNHLGLLHQNPYWALKAKNIAPPVPMNPIPMFRNTDSNMLVILTLQDCNGGPLKLDKD